MKKKRSVKNCNCGKNEITKHCCKECHKFSCVQKKVFDVVSRLISRKVKETIHSLKHPNQINKVFCMLPEKWLPNLP